MSDAPPRPDDSAHVSRKTTASGDWLELHAVTWRGPDGETHSWEAAERTGGRDAVVVVARLSPSDRVLLIRQYRPPAESVVVEFPAGLLDDGESAETGALRELREETGYAADIVRVVPPAFTTPGMTSEAVWIVVATIDETAPENADPTPAFDGHECIETVVVPVAELDEFLDTQREAGTRIDSKVAVWALGVTSGAD